MILSRTGFSILDLKMISIRHVGVEWVSGLICTSICEFPGLDLRQMSHIMGLLWLFVVHRGKHGYSTLDLRQKSHIMGLIWLYVVHRGKHGYSTLDLRQSHIMGLLWFFVVPRAKHG